MGNLCSKSANRADHFTTPGRVLGSSSQTAPSSAPVPKQLTTSTPGRPLGGSSKDASSPENARSAAAKAAEVSVAVSALTNLLRSRVEKLSVVKAALSKDP